MTLPLPSPTVVFQKLEDGAMLFAPASETYFGLNEVGAFIWQRLPPVSATFDALCSAVAERYPDAPLATIRTDVIELLEALAAEGLVLGETSRSDAAPPA